MITRLFFIDNIRIVLTILVVLHHIALTYGARSGWYYYESTSDQTTNIILTVFLAVNRSFFMGLFFMISGYFTPGSFDRKGAGRFMADRLVRLGIPLILFSCIIRPTLVYTMNFSSLGTQYSFWENITEFKNVAPGPLWFVEILLLFSFLYAMMRLLKGGVKQKTRSSESSAPGALSILVFICILSLVTFLIRIYYPPSVQLFHLRIGNYAQYVALYIVGIEANKRNWIGGLSQGAGRLWVAVTSAALLLYVLVTVEGIRAGTVKLLTGGLNWYSLVGATLESFLCVGMMISLMFVFRSKWNFQGRLTKAMSGDAFTVYIMHAPIIVYFTYLIRSVMHDQPLLKFACVSVVGVSLTFLVSHFVRRIPGANRIL